MVSKERTGLTGSPSSSPQPERGNGFSSDSPPTRRYVDGSYGNNIGKQGVPWPADAKPGVPLSANPNVKTTVQTPATTNGDSTAAKGQDMSTIDQDRSRMGQPETVVKDREKEEVRGKGASGTFKDDADAIRKRGANFDMAGMSGGGGGIFVKEGTRNPEGPRYFVGILSLIALLVVLGAAGYGLNRAGILNFSNLVPPNPDDTSSENSDTGEDGIESGGSDSPDDELTEEEMRELVEMAHEGGLSYGEIDKLLSGGVSEGFLTQYLLETYEQGGTTEQDLIDSINYLVDNEVLSIEEAEDVFEQARVAVERTSTPAPTPRPTQTEAPTATATPAEVVRAETVEITSNIIEENQDYFDNLPWMDGDANLDKFEDFIAACGDIYTELLFNNEYGVIQAIMETADGPETVFYKNTFDSSIDNQTRFELSWYFLSDEVVHSDYKPGEKGMEIDIFTGVNRDEPIGAADYLDQPEVEDEQATIDDFIDMLINAYKGQGKPLDGTRFIVNYVSPERGDSAEVDKAIGLNFLFQTFGVRLMMEDEHTVSGNAELAAGEDPWTTEANAYFSFIALLDQFVTGDRLATNLIENGRDVYLTIKKQANSDSAPITTVEESSK